MSFDSGSTNNKIGFNWGKIKHPIVFGFILFLLAWTTALLMPIPQKSAEEVLGNGMGVFYFSKIVHVTVYTIIAIWAGFLSKNRSSLWILLVLLSLHGWTSEGLQLITKYHRTGRIADVGLDHLGLLLGLILNFPRWRYLFISNKLSTDNPPNISP